MEGRYSEIFEAKTDQTRGVMGENLGERIVIIGNPLSPLWHGTLSKAKTLFDENFWTIYDAWRSHRAGLLAISASDDTIDANYILGIRGLEEYWQVHFSPRSCYYLLS